MRRALRENAPCALAATAASVVVAWLGLYSFAWNDYEVEVKPAFDALIAGHVARFLALAPAYGGSLVERAPFALLPSLWGGGALAVYRAVAVPCLLAGVALAVWLCAQMRRARRPLLWRSLAVGLCVANPLTVRALELGHAEELLGACLCVGAVLTAQRGHTLWAGSLLGLAIANKQWAVVAAGPVLLAAWASCNQSAASVRRKPGLCLLATAIVCGLLLAPFLFVTGGAVTRSSGGIGAGELFQPWQAWWFFGTPNHVGAAAGARVVVQLNASISALISRPGWRLAPGWVGTVSHPAIILSAAALALLAWPIRRREGAPLLLLALLLLLRCLLDSWDAEYYMIPFVIALLAWEARSEATRPALLALMSTALAWLSFQGLSAHGASPDEQAGFFIAWTTPLAAAMALRLFLPDLITRPRSGNRTRRPHARWRALPGRAPQPTTVSSLGSPFSSS
jgi:hypothetical protein